MAYLDSREARGQPYTRHPGPGSRRSPSDIFEGSVLARHGFSVELLPSLVGSSATVTAYITRVVNQGRATAEATARF